MKITLNKAMKSLERMQAASAREKQKTAEVTRELLSSGVSAVSALAAGYIDGRVPDDKSTVLGASIPLAGAVIFKAAGLLVRHKQAYLLGAAGQGMLDWEAGKFGFKTGQEHAEKAEAGEAAAGQIGEAADDLNSVNLRQHIRQVA